MNDTKKNLCLTCHGAGEIPTDLGPEICPDCQGDDRPPGRRELVEWRLRDIERVHVGDAHPCAADVRWLAYQVRRGHDVLRRILSRCQDSDQDPLASDVKYMVNEALELYEPI
jgi:hypothetical protein